MTKNRIILISVFLSLFYKHAQGQQNVIVESEPQTTEYNLTNTNSNDDNSNSRVLSSTGDANDIGTPFQQSFNASATTAKKTINPVTGKVNLNVPLSSLFSGKLSYSLNINYNGTVGFKTGQEYNQYSPTSVLGVGWSLPSSKIVVDNKKTTALEDDEFYLIESGSSNKLICTKQGEDILEFKTEKYSRWKIRYVKQFDEFIDDPQNPQGGQILVKRKADYWEIIRDNGDTHYFGYTNNSYPYPTGVPNSSTKSKEFLVAWGNWIGDSKQTGGEQTTIVWNLSRITNQWKSKIDFEYELQESTQSGNVKQTEAAFLKKVTSSKGASIVFNYELKNAEEYYEPHIEEPEPDAYQERYEGKYLRDIEIYNNSNILIKKYDFVYKTIGGYSYNKLKRYLEEISPSSYSNNKGDLLPSQQFEYYETGDFQGALKKVTYPTGGTVTYNYESKNIFYNGANKYENAPQSNPGYGFYGQYVSDNYNVYVRRSQNPASTIGGIVPIPLYRFVMYRHWWTGDQWKSDEFIFPHDLQHSDREPMKGFQSVFGKDFYAFAFSGSNSDLADVYLFHKSSDGFTWHKKVYTGVYVGNERPRLMSGNGFVALGAHRDGKIHTYVWNGKDDWSTQTLHQWGGRFFYSATNNFILSLNEIGGNDVIDNNTYNDDLYYFHYLDAEKNWKTKSWSGALDPYIANIEAASYFYPSNSMTGFVADRNPEFFIRWDKNYDVVAVDNIGRYDDRNPIQPINNSLFTLHNFHFGDPYVSLRFNGLSWTKKTFPDDAASGNYHKLNFGNDLMTLQNHSIYSAGGGVGYQIYDPNNTTFISKAFAAGGVSSTRMANGIFSDVIIAGNRVYRKRRTNQEFKASFNFDSSLYNVFTKTDGLRHAFVELSNTSDSGFQEGKYVSFNKKSNSFIIEDTGKMHLSGKYFGGYNQFMSPKAISLRSVASQSGNYSTFLYRIIDDRFSQTIKDVVVSSIELDDKNSGVKKIEFKYNNPKQLEDNNTTYYGEVITENVGYGNNSSGKIKRLYNVNSNDIRLFGVLTEEHFIDTEGNTKRQVTNIWEKKENTIYNSTNKIVGQSYYIALKEKREKVTLNSNAVINTTTTNNYNLHGQINKITTQNSDGLKEEQIIRYAHEQYTFVKNENMYNDVYETTTTVNDKIVNIDRVKWVESGNRIYAKENWSGINNPLRLNSELTYIDNQGNVLENHDGHGNYKCVLNGYNDTYNVATITNAKYQDVINELDVTYEQLQNLDTSSLKTELLKLYDRLPNAMISLTFYDENGKLINKIDERKQNAFYHYDIHGRFDYSTDEDGNVLTKKEYNYGN